ncbi:MAG: hypothetical protein Q7T25_09780 [Sideroxyarcus sp.]|nr:hypothetical protein [Sideroxyarcus sp.]
MSASRIFPTDGGRQKLASSFCKSHGAAGRTSLVLPGICGTKAGCIFTEPEMKIVLERGISLSYHAFSEVVKAGYGMFSASISQDFMLEFVSRTPDKAAFEVRKSSHFSSIFCVLLSQKRTKNSRICSGRLYDGNVNICVLAIEIRVDFVTGEYFVSVDIPISKKFSNTFDPSIPDLYDGIVRVSAAFSVTFIGPKALFFCESESFVNDISVAKYFSITPFPSENGHETPSTHGAAGGQIRQRQQVHALYTDRRFWKQPKLARLSYIGPAGVSHG